MPCRRGWRTTSLCEAFLRAFLSSAASVLSLPARRGIQRHICTTHPPQRYLLLHIPISSGVGAGHLDITQHLAVSHLSRLTFLLLMATPRTGKGALLSSLARKRHHRHSYAILYAQPASSWFATNVNKRCRMAFHNTTTTYASHLTHGTAGCWRRATWRYGTLRCDAASAYLLRCAAAAHCAAPRLSPTCHTAAGIFCARASNACPSLPRAFFCANTRANRAALSNGA